MTAMDATVRYRLPLVAVCSDICTLLVRSKTPVAAAIIQ